MYKTRRYQRGGFGGVIAGILRAALPAMRLGAKTTVPVLRSGAQLVRSKAPSVIKALGKELTRATVITRPRRQRGRGKIRKKRVKGNKRRQMRAKRKTKRKS